MMRSVAFVAIIASCSLTGAPPAAAQTNAVPADWSGTWRGTLQNFPARPGAPQVEVTREIGARPVSDSSCAVLRTTYREAGAVRAVKDYKLCRGTGPDDWYVDEGDGLTLAARFIGDALIAPFKYDDLILVSTTRVRGDLLEEEILTVDDRPAGKGALSLHARGVQRLEMRRVR